MKSKKIIFFGLVTIGLISGVVLLGTILGKNSTDDVVVDSSGKVREGSNASYAVARETEDNQLVKEFLSKVEENKNKIYNEDTDEYEYKESETKPDGIEVEEQESLDNNLSLYHVDEDTSRQYWISWEQSNVDDMYYYSDDFMPDMIVGLLAGNIKYCPMITSDVQSKYKDGIIPQSSSVSVSTIDTENCNATVVVVFTDNSTKTYNISYHLNSMYIVDEFTVSEGA